MAKRHVLIAGFSDVAGHLEALLPKVSSQIELLAVADGVRCITAHAKLAAAGVPPLVVVLPDELEFVSGPHVARTLRATERGLGASASALLYASGDGSATDVATLVADLGRAVHLRWPAGQSSEQAAQRLMKAIAKVVEQLRKRGKS